MMLKFPYLAPENETGGGGVVDATPVDVTPSDATPAPVEQPVTMEDTIRQTYAKLNPTRERDPSSGRFASKTAAPLATDSVDDSTPTTSPTTDVPPSDPSEAAAAAPAAPVVDTNPDKLEFVDNQGNKHAVDITKPPLSFRAEAKAAYEAAPDSLKREMHKREHDFHQGVSQYKGAANFALSIGSEFKPYEALIRSQNHTPQVLTRDFMNTHYVLSTGTPQQKVQHLIEGAAKYGITVQDLQSALQSVPSDPAQQVHPIVQQLQQKLQTLEGQLTEQQRQTQAREEADIQVTIKRFEGDGKHEHFKLVAADMGALLANGRAVDMQDAYDKTCWANPEIRAKLMAKQAADQRKIDAEKAASAKRASSVNVTARGKHPAVAPSGSMEDTIRATLHRLNGGA
jgi:DNA-binding transcriptional MerR regulator